MNDLSRTPDEDLEMYRPYLLCLARQHLDRRLQSKVDLSGVVNLTLFEARQRLADVLGRKEDDLLRWLRSILAHNLIDETRSFRGPSRDVGREVSMEADLDQSSNRLAACLMSEQTSPSQRMPCGKKSQKSLLQAAFLTATISSVAGGCPAPMNHHIHSIV
jgi:RNA polymerase sigma-70 factor, ECF subfamily